MLTDTHCHFEDERYDADRDRVIADNLKELAFVVDVSEKLEDFDAVLELAKKENKVYAALGVHPHHALKVMPQDAAAAIERALARANNRVVAVGECGLDYFWNNQGLAGRTEHEVKEAQRKLFKAQIDVALKNHLPLILHIRDGLIPKDAYIDALEILKSKTVSHSNIPGNLGMSGTVHTFSSDLQIAKEFIGLGFYLGISGVITFPKTEKLAEVIKEVPLEKLLLETDAPYLAPVPHRGKRNEPKFARFTAEKIAEIKNVGIDEVLDATEQNARKLFGIAL